MSSPSPSASSSAGASRGLLALAAVAIGFAAADTYVVVLANVIHQRGGPPITKLAGEVATAAGRALHLYS